MKRDLKLARDIPCMQSRNVHNRRWNSRTYDLKYDAPSAGFDLLFSPYILSDDYHRSFHYFNVVSTVLEYFRNLGMMSVAWDRSRRRWKEI